MLLMVKTGNILTIIPIIAVIVFLVICVWILFIYKSDYRYTALLNKFKGEIL